MTMTYTLFRQITLDAKPLPAMAGDERRGQPRMMMNIRAPLAAVTRGVRSDPMTVIVREVSMTGIGFMTSERMRVGKEFVIAMPTGNQRSVALHGNVVHVEAGGSGNNFFNVGAIFTRMGDPTTLEATTATIHAGNLTCWDTKKSIARDAHSPSETH